MGDRRIHPGFQGAVDRAPARCRPRRHDCGRPAFAPANPPGGDGPRDTSCHVERGMTVMRAVVQDRYGPPEVLHVAEVERPVPGPGGVLIRVRASTVSQTDTHIRGANVLWRLLAGWNRPRWRTLGVDFAGVVEAVGSGVQEYAVGDEVFGLMGWSVPGAHADYVCVSERGAIAHKPSNLTFAEARP